MWSTCVDLGNKKGNQGDQNELKIDFRSLGTYILIYTKERVFHFHLKYLTYTLGVAVLYVKLMPNLYMYGTEERPWG